MDALSRDTVRRLDRFAIETLGVPGVVLMENAGRGAAEAAEEMLGGAAGRRVAVVAGAGNNAGDGFVIARHLGIRGARVATFLVAPAEKITGDARVNLDVLRALAGEITPVTGDELNRLGETLAAFDLVVDAVGGTGIQGALRGAAATAVEQINAAGRPVLAVDIPTGLDCDTGAAAGPVVRATMTVTFLARKTGFDAPGAAEFTGEVRVLDIGVPAERIARMAPEA